ERRIGDRFEPARGDDHARVAVRDGRNRAALAQRLDDVVYGAAVVEQAIAPPLQIEIAGAFDCRERRRADDVLIRDWFRRDVRRRGDRVHPEGQAKQQGGEETRETTSGLARGYVHVAPAIRAAGTDIGVCD